MDPSIGTSMEPVVAQNTSKEIFLDKHVAVRVVVGATCVLSMLGSTLIILSYFCF